MCMASSVALVVVLRRIQNWCPCKTSRGRARNGRQAFEAYLAKMRFVTGQPSNNSL